MKQNSEPGRAYYVGIRPGGEAIVEIHGPDRVRRLNPRYDLRNHSPDGFEWGYGGSGPAQLALAILCDATGNDQLAQRLYQKFKFAVIARQPQGGRFCLPQASVLEWVEGHDQEQERDPDLQSVSE